jgi:hypothetical protein
VRSALTDARRNIAFARPVLSCSQRRRAAIPILT